MTIVNTRGWGSCWCCGHKTRMKQDRWVVVDVFSFSCGSCGGFFSPKCDKLGNVVIDYEDTLIG